MADLRDEILKLGGGRISGSRAYIPLKGRDPGDFTGLLQFGQIEVKADQIVLKLNSAQRKVMALERAADRAARRAEKAALKQTRATRRSKFFGATAEGANIGPLSITKSGFRVNRAYLRASGGQLYTASIATHIAALGVSSANSAVDNIRRMASQGATDGEILRASGLGAARAVSEVLLTVTGIKALAFAYGKMGYSEEDFEAGYQRLMSKVFDTREQIERNRAERDRLIQRTNDEVTSYFNKLWDRILHHTPTTILLKGKQELALYKRDMFDINIRNMEIREDAVRKMALAEAYKAMREVP